MEIALAVQFRDIAPYIGAGFLIVALIFVYRSFYKMRINQ
jgi:K(+)-stimulated pyrophosphate-energized sodium pump